MTTDAGRLLETSSQAILLAGLIRRMDLATLAGELEKWETLAPFVDPTAWLRANRQGDPFGENMRLLRVILPGLQRVQKDVTAYLDSLPAAHPIRQEYERERAEIGR